MDQANHCKYGTFLYNCERERLSNSVHLRTESLWIHVRAYREKYVDPAYRPNPNTLYISSSPKKIQL